MLNKSAASLLSSLKQMILYCRDIQLLLDSDVAHFSNNAVQDIAISNDRKALLIEKLTHLVNEINSISAPQFANTHTFLEKIEKHAERLDSAARKAVEQATTELKAEIAKAYQSIATNSTIVSTNMLQVKLVWDKLLAFRSEIEYVYDQNGNPGK
ncbi:hypothetical protein AQUSIP_24120 [Aquicella siphonis]|uniref:Uncharacterized protein n=1 Tax=Aquicella siphonis TaxID=254247 RepID=A0A5E4PKL4_9COXI|nr:hypothetical protein [Aquicella siphonis]VVC77085.1 hypothetical protein AQUSIP_24120 [Aquicella siphonis]